MSPRQALLVGGAILAVAAFWRLFLLGRTSFWLDEVASVSYAQMDSAAFWYTLSERDANMSLFYALLRGWLVFGSNEFVVRLLPVLAGVAAVPAIYALGTRLFDRHVGLLSAALLAVNAYHVQYSQQARSYTLVVLLAILSSLCFLRAVDRPTFSRWGLYVLVSTLAIYSHFFAALVLLGHWAAALLRPRSVPWGSFFASSAAVLLAILPILQFVATKDAGQIGWADPPQPRDLFGLICALGGGSQATGVFYVLACGAAFASLRFHRSPAGTAILLRRRQGVGDPERNDTWGLHFVALGLVLPMAVSFALSHLAKPVYVYRYLIVCLPPLIIWASAGLSRIDPPRLRLVLIAFVLVLSTERVVRYYEKAPEHEDWRGASRLLAETSRPDDVVLFYHPYLRLPFEWYAREKGLEVAAPVVFPAPWNELMREPELEFGPSPELLKGLRAPRVWLLLSHHQNTRLRRYKVARQIRGILASRYRSVHHRPLPGVDVFLYSQPKSPSDPGKDG